MAYLRNTWYVAAWDEEIKAGELFSRQLLSEQVVFYREQSGRVRALVDRCPHRFAPLSKGTLCGDVVRCPYHGLEFGGEPPQWVGRIHGQIVFTLQHLIFLYL